mmetsp:Transcript_3877/g.5005  ORF Transcript_3877/g.5005 Transcript_3877/m.5005 type:complete len:506 (+) Transcript_3877:94-1611(+)
MRVLILSLACLTCVAHRSSEQVPAKAESHELEMIAALLRRSNPAVAFRPSGPGAGIAKGSPPLRNLRRLSMVDDQDFLSSSEFDFLQGKSFRRDAIMRYDMTQRGQQLRLLFYGFAAVVALFFPYLQKELNPGAGELDAGGLVGCVLSSVLFGGLAAYERQLRGKVLLRYDRESQLGELSIWQPRAALGGSKKEQIKSLKDKKRVVALYGSPSVLLAAVQRAAIYRRRLKQSGTVLIAVPTPGTDAADEKWQNLAVQGEVEGWLWQPLELNSWREYFQDLLEGPSKNKGTTPEGIAATEGAFFALSLKGRSCASGTGAIAWDELLGTQLPPLEQPLDTEPAAQARNSEEESLLAAQRALYDALSTADSARVASLFSPVDDEEVTALEVNGRLDEWSTVLKYDATVGLILCSQDATVNAEGQEAFTTGLEFPKGAGGSLLCTQRWVNTNAGVEGAAPNWQLRQHRTIPYAENVDAAACLRCDHRGCCALQRAGPSGPAGMPGDGKA